MSVSWQSPQWPGRTGEEPGSGEASGEAATSPGRLAAQARAREKADMAGSGVSIPRTIWFLWFQGIHHAPYVVRKCHESWMARNPSWRIMCLDAATVPDFTSVDYFSGNIGTLSPQHRADLLRLDLLSHHGGVWADATCFCVRPLDDWLPHSAEAGFFAFHRPGPDRLISNWFLAAEPGNVLVSRLFDRMLAYWGDHALRAGSQDLRVKVLTRLLRVSARTRGWWFSPALADWLGVGPYFAFAYGFEKLIRDDPECAHAWRRMSKISADGPHRLYRAGLLAPAKAELRSEIDRGEIPVYKTTWRIPDHGIPSGSILEYLLQTLTEA
jgi:Capsular polysaccharide synthesis protein